MGKRTWKERIISFSIVLVLLLSNSGMGSLAAPAKSKSGFVATVPEEIPSYYKQAKVQAQDIYSFIGRDNKIYYRVHGTVGGIKEGFYSCAQYITPIDTENKIDLDAEKGTIAPYIFEDGTLAEPLPNEDYEKDEAISVDKGYTVYSYPDVDGEVQYRAHVQISNVEDPAITLGWYSCDSEGVVNFENGIIKDINKDSLNLWIKGFKEEIPVDVPQFYGNPSEALDDESIHERERVWSYTDRAGKTRNRVYGSIDGGAPAFYESDAYGNVIYPAAKVDMDVEENTLKPNTSGPGGALKPDEALITATNISYIKDGTANFDADNNAGNDLNDSNKIVRTFDSIVYMINYTVGIQKGNIHNSFTEGNLYIQFELPTTKDKAFFDTDAMNWLLDKKVVEKDGKQILTGRRFLEKGSSPAAIPASGTLSAIIKVQGMKNGDIIKPTFTLWMDGNEPDPAHESKEAKQVVADDVKVSAAPKYNIKLKRQTYMAIRGEFDFNSGEEATALTIDPKYGRMYGYGVTIQLHNDNADKGLKGIELPQGAITFELDLKMEETVTLAGITKDVTNIHMPLLWDYKKNDEANIGNLERRMHWRGQVNTRRATLVAPGAKQAGSTRAYTYESGTFNANQTGNTISVTVKDYDFGTYKFPTNDVGDSEVTGVKYGANVGSFSAGYFQILAQVPKSVSEPTDYSLTVTDKNLKATSVSGAVVNGAQTKNDDDSDTVQVPLLPIGGFGRYNWLNKETSNTGLYSHYTLGDAWTIPGTKIAIAGGFSVGATNDSEKFARSVNILQKFDDEAFEIPSDAVGTWHIPGGGNAPESGNDYTLIYAAKPDGTGWNDDTEMDKAMEEDLEYYETIGELNTAGKICVAVLIEGRNGIGSSGRQEYVGFNVMVKESAEVGKVYQTTNEVRIWTQEGGLGETQTRLNPSANYPTYVSVYSNYIKSEYQEDGSIKAGTHSSSYVGGQSLLMVGLQAFIEKGIDQQTGGSEKKVFDLDIGQRQVDYVLKPRITTGNSHGTGTGIKTDVLITDTLPLGLTYAYGSGKIGGVYTPDGSVNGGSVIGGQSEDPTIDIVKDANGKDVQQLTWKLENVDVDIAIEMIHFSALIGTPSNPTEDVENSENLMNTVRIQADGDGRVVKTANGNLATAGISVIKLDATKLVKSVKKPMHEIGEDITYNLSYSNSSNLPLNGMKLLDILPYNGDDRGTNFDGSYWIESINVETSDATAANLKLSYSTDENLRGTTAKDVNVTGFIEATKAAPSGGITKFTISNAGSPIMPTAILLSGQLGGQESVKVTLTLKVKNNKSGNIYGNDATAFATGLPNNLLAPMVQATVVRRTVEGTTWLDSNRDGKRDSREAYLEGVKVILSDAGGVVTKDIAGDPFGDVYTDANGKYKFANLKEGTYKVSFESSPVVDLSQYTLTKKNAAGVSQSTNSKADAVLNGGLLQSAFIQNIKMPVLADMKVYDYKSSYQDAGFYAPFTFKKSSNPTGGTVDAGGNPVNPTLVEEGQVITYTLTADSPLMDMDNITISDVVPEGLSLVKGSISYQLQGKSVEQVNNAAYNESSRTITWPELKLLKGASTMSFKVVVNKLPEGVDEKVFSNFAVLKERGNDSTTTETETITHKTLTRKATIEKTASLVEDDGSGGEHILGEETGTDTAPVETARRQIIEYHLIVKNTGDPQSKSGELVIVDAIPKGTTFIAGTMKSSFRSSTNPAVPYPSSTATEISAQFTSIETEMKTPAIGVKWILDELSNEEEAYLTFRVSAPITTDNPETEEYETEQVFTNQSRLIDEQLKGKLYEEDCDGHLKGDPVYEKEAYEIDSNTTYHKVREPLVSAVKSSVPKSLDDNNFVPVVKEGETITYFITLNNTGSTSAKSVKVRDFIPEYTTYVENSINLSGVVNSISVGGETKDRAEWVIPEIAVGEEVIVSFQVTVDPLNKKDGARILKNAATYKTPDETLPDDPATEEDGYIDTNTVLHQVSSFIKYATPMGGSDENDAVFIKQGQAIKYTLQLNAEEILNDISVTDVVPKGMAVVPKSISYTEPDGTVVAVKDSAYDEATRTISWPKMNSKIGITKFEFKVVVEKLPKGTYGKLYNNKAILELSDPSKDPVETNEVVHKTNTGFSNIHKDATTILVDKNGKETVDVDGRGSEGKPILTELGQVVEYKLTVDRVGDVENKSGNIIVVDCLPEGTTFVEGSIKGKFTNEITNSTATIVSMEYKLVEDKKGVKKPGIEWVLHGLSNEEIAELTFRVYAPTKTKLPETSQIFKNKADLLDVDLKELVYEESTKDQDKDDPLYTLEEYEKESETTYHIVKVPQLEISKSSDPASGSIVKDDTIITYSIKVKNTGDGSGKGVMIRDVIPEFTSYVKNSEKSSMKDTDFTMETVNGKEALLWTIKELKSRQSVTVSFQVKVDKMDAVGNREIKNVAQVKLPNDVEETKFVNTNEVVHKQEKKSQGAPKTGDGVVMIWYIIILGAAIGAREVYKKKKLKKQ